MAIKCGSHKALGPKKKAPDLPGPLLCGQGSGRPQNSITEQELQQVPCQWLERASLLARSLELLEWRLGP